jgi:branched-chain amino acid transport system substrate-binding protein
MRENRNVAATGRAIDRAGTLACTFAIAAALVCSSAAIAPDARAGDKLRVGIVLPLSGQFALNGQNIRRGYDLAIEDINKAGGIKALGGMQIEAIYADNQGKQDVAIGETERLIQQENVSAIMGSGHSPTTIAGTQAAERNKTPWIVEVAAADIILERGFKYITRVNVKASWYGQAPVDFLDYAKKELEQKVERVAIMYTDDDWGRASIAKGSGEALKNRGYQVVEEIAYPSASQDVTTYINKIKASRPDAFIVTSFPNDAVLVGRTAEQLNLKVPIAIGVSSGYILPSFRSSLGAAAEKWLIVGGWNPDIPGAKPLADRFKQKFNTDMNEHTALAYQAAIVLKEAVELAKSTEREKINDAVHALKISPGPQLIMPYEGIEFDAIGQNPHARQLIMQVQQGQLVTVWPGQFASTKPVLPFR